MQCFFVNIKCEFGWAYKVAAEIADAHITSEIHSTSSDWDSIAECHV